MDERWASGVMWCYLEFNLRNLAIHDFDYLVSQND